MEDGGVYEEGNAVMERIAVIMGKMHSGGKKNLVMEYYRHIDRSRVWTMS